LSFWEAKHTANLLDGGWLTVLQKPEKRADGSQTDISRLG